MLAESGAPAYSGYGLALFLGSSATEAARVVASQVLLGSRGYSSADVLLYVGGPSALLLMGAGLVLEGRSMLSAAAALAAVRPGALVRAWAMSAAVNLTSYLAISTTSSLTFKVAGCLKNLAVIWVGVAAHGDSVTAWHMLGYAVSVAGFLLYTMHKTRGAGGTVQVVKRKAA